MSPARGKRGTSGPRACRLHSMEPGLANASCTYLACPLHPTGKRGTRRTRSRGSIIRAKFVAAPGDRHSEGDLCAVRDGVHRRGARDRRFAGPGCWHAHGAATAGSRGLTSTVARLRRLDWRGSHTDVAVSGTRTCSPHHGERRPCLVCWLWLARACSRPALSIGLASTSCEATPQPALLLLLTVMHGLARFVDLPAGRADVDLVAREWERPRPDEEVSLATIGSQAAARLARCARAFGDSRSALPAKRRFTSGSYGQIHSCRFRWICRRSGSDGHPSATRPLATAAA